MSKNLNSIDADLASASGTLLEVEDNFLDAERALETVTAAIGTVREQFSKIASDLNRAERGIDKDSRNLPRNR